MIYKIKNDELEVSVDTLGAEIKSVKRGDIEYIWQGGLDGSWTSHAPVLFPICGRLNNGEYVYRDKTYKLGLHGFAHHSNFSLCSYDSESIVLTLASNEETARIYPFDFEIKVQYRLADDRLYENAVITNKGGDVMPAAFGGHPGFALFDEMGELSDCRLEFDKACSPDKLLLTERGLYSGKNTAYPISDGKIISLSESVLDVDGLFLSNTSHKVRLCSRKCEHGVELAYDDMPYLGIWHTYGDRFICLEPWCGLPSYDGICDDIETKNDMFRIPPESEKSVGFMMRFF